MSGVVTKKSNGAKRGKLRLEGRADSEGDESAAENKAEGVEEGLGGAKHFLSVVITVKEGSDFFCKSVDGGDRIGKDVGYGT